MQVLSTGRQASQTARGRLEASAGALGPPELSVARVRAMRECHLGGGLHVVLRVLGYVQSHEGRGRHFRQGDEHPSQCSNTFAYQFPLWEKL